MSHLDISRVTTVMNAEKRSIGMCRPILMLDNLHHAFLWNANIILHLLLPTTCPAGTLSHFPLLIFQEFW
jgi:hypothetical protein